MSLKNYQLFVSLLPSPLSFEHPMRGIIFLWIPWKVVITNLTYGGFYCTYHSSGSTTNKAYFVIHIPTEIWQRRHDNDKSNKNRLWLDLVPNELQVLHDSRTQLFELTTNLASHIFSEDCYNSYFIDFIMKVPSEFISGSTSIRVRYIMVESQMGSSGTIIIGTDWMSYISKLSPHVKTVGYKIDAFVLPIWIHKIEDWSIVQSVFHKISNLSYLTKFHRDQGAQWYVLIFFWYLNQVLQTMLGSENSAAIREEKQTKRRMNLKNHYLSEYLLPFPILFEHRLKAINFLFIWCKCLMQIVYQCFWLCSMCCCELSCTWWNVIPFQGRYL